MKAMVAAISLIALSAVTHVNAKDAFYELPSNLQETITAELLDESMLLLRQGSHTNWITMDFGDNGGLLHIHKPTIKVNIGNNTIFYWQMIVFWNDLKKGNLRGFFPPFLMEMDCENSRTRRVGHFDQDKLSVLKADVAWGKSHDRTRINLCPELGKIKETEFKKYEEFLKRKKSEEQRNLKIM